VLLVRRIITRLLRGLTAMFDAPPPSPLLYEVQRLVAAGDCPGGYRVLLRLLRDEPGNAAGWFNMGGLLERLRQWDAAVACFRRAVDLVPGFVTARMALGWHLHLAGRTAEAEGVLREVVGVDGGQALAHTNLGHVLTTLGREEEGLAEHLKGVDLAPTDALVRLGLAFSLFFNRRWRDGFAAFDARIGIKMPELQTYPWPRWEGGRVGTLFLQGEQGLGDSLMMLRYFAAVDGLAERVLLNVQGALVGLCREMWPHWEVTAMPDVMPSGVDAWCPLMSLPSVFSDLPCPYWEGAYVPGYVGNQAGGVLRVGLCWSGDPKHDNDAHRSVALRELLPLTELPGMEFVSLQHGGTKDIDSCGAHALVRDYGPEITDVRDTVRIVRGLDLVVTVDTAVAHLAGAMGCPVWLLVNQRGCDWRWGRRGETTQWYPTTRIFRRSLDEQWVDVIGPVGDELRETVARSGRRDLASERVLGAVA
jgi:hypothetical protein